MLLLAGVTLAAAGMSLLLVTLLAFFFPARGEITLAQEASFAPVRTNGSIAARNAVRASVTLAETAVKSGSSGVFASLLIVGSDTLELTAAVRLVDTHAVLAFTVMNGSAHGLAVV